MRREIGCDWGGGGGYGEICFGRGAEGKSAPRPGKFGCLRLLFEVDAQTQTAELVEKHV